METFSKYVTEIFSEYVMEILEVFLPVTQEEKNVLYQCVFRLDWLQESGGLLISVFEAKSTG